MPGGECVRGDVLTWQHVALFAITTLAGLVSAAISAHNSRGIQAVKKAVNGAGRAEGPE